MGLIDHEGLDLKDLRDLHQLMLEEVQKRKSITL